MTRQKNDGLRKVCGCQRRVWAKCPHPWHFSFKLPKGTAYRFSLDRYLGRHIDSKTEAETEADAIRREIQAGHFGQPAPREGMTLRQLADMYLGRYVAVERARTATAFHIAMNTICSTAVPTPTSRRVVMGEWRVSDIVTDTIERFREVRRATTGATGVNRNLGSLRAMFNWAIRVGYMETSPFLRGSQPVVKLSQEHARSRRLEADEEVELLRTCAPPLRATVEAAIETGMRSGEIHSLQWTQVEGMRLDGSHVTWEPRSELFLPVGKTKTSRDRRIPISTRLKAVLEMRRFDPAGEPIPMDGYVFGDEIGQHVESNDRAWHAAVLKSHGHTPTYTKTANLSAASRAALQAIDLHFREPPSGSWLTVAGRRRAAAYGAGLAGTH